MAFPPILTTDVSGTIQLEPGASWSLKLEAEDPDGDLADIFVTFSDSSDNWLGFTQSTLTIETTDLGR